jgi:probable addiction module antidote protein
MALETTRFEVLEPVRSPADHIAYMEAVLEDGDPSLIAAALGDIARARGVSEFARETGLSRETIYKSFRPGGNPTLETIAKAMRALGLRLTATAVPREAA